MGTRKLGKGALLLVLFGLILALGFAWKVTQGQDGIVYYACVNNSSGTIKVWQEPQPCSSNEFPIEWNSEGPQGPPGNLALAGQTCTTGYVGGFDDAGDIICVSSLEAETEVCDNVDNDRDGLLNEDLAYCFNNVPAPNTDGSTCVDGYADYNNVAEDGCEGTNYDHLSGTWTVYKFDFTCAVPYDSGYYTYQLSWPYYLQLEVQFEDENITLIPGAEEPGPMSGVFTDLDNGAFTIQSEPVAPVQYRYQGDGVLTNGDQIGVALYMMSPEDNRECYFTNFFAYR